MGFDPADPEPKGKGRDQFREQPENQKGIMSSSNSRHMHRLRLVPQWLLSIAGIAMALAVAPSCSIPLRVLQLRASLRRRLDQLRLKLAHQVETLPLGNESWLQTERELVAAEKALHTLANGER